MRRARCVEPVLVREVGIHGVALDAGSLRDRRDRRPRGTDARMQGDRCLDDPASRAHPIEREPALEGAGGLSYWLGDMAPAEAAYHEALALARSNGDPRRISNALYNLSFLQVWANVDKDPAERAAKAIADVEEALALARQVDDRGAIARCLWAKANVMNYLGSDPAAGPGAARTVRSRR